MTDNGFTKSLDKFGTGLKDVFTDVTTLEVNTIIVSQITGMKFDPEEQYRLIYNIPQNLAGYSNTTIEAIGCFSCDDDKILERFKDENLCKRHMNIRQKLEKLVNYISLKDANGQIITNLPSPETESAEVKLLLKNDRFLRELRKLSELKQVLESEEADENNVYDIIYAQTVIQLDGDIINRFDRKLFDNKDKDFLIKTHNDAVIAGEKNWRELLKLLVELVKDVATALSQMPKS